MYNVLVADDHPIFRDGLRSIINKIFENPSIAEAGDFMSVQKLLDDGFAPDLLVLDVYFPGFEVMRDLATLRHKLALTPIAVVSMLNDQDIVQTIMSKGVNGFVSKSVPPEIMATALKEIADGELIVRQSSGPQITESAPEDPLAALSPRQHQVLTLICRGMSNKEIARSLDISPFTVRLHVSAMMAALHVNGRSAAAAFGSSRGLS
jgi:two-component system nitrate/nitrite response regulator NarL